MPCRRPHELEQLADPAGRGQRAVAHVVLEVELVVLGPEPRARRCATDRFGPLEEQRRDLGGLDRLLEQLADPLGARALGRGEQLEPADVHRGVARLGEHEARAVGSIGTNMGVPFVGSMPSHLSRSRS